MDYELLQHKAEQICNSDTCNGPLNNKLGRGMWIMTSYNFNCSGNITSLLLGGDLRLNKYSNPTISLWSRQGEGSTIYNKVVGSERTLSLDPYNFSTSGPLLYHLSEPLQFESGQILGLFYYFFWKRTLRLYYIDDSLTKIYSLRLLYINSNTIDTSKGSNVNNVEYKEVLIYPKTSKYILLI